MHRPANEMPASNIAMGAAVPSGQLRRQLRPETLFFGCLRQEANLSSGGFLHRYPAIIKAPSAVRHCRVLKMSHFTPLVPVAIHSILWF
jgi:hypothetical protein